ncbi:MAG: amidinotransferase [Synergistaceae bacterium]|jgi:N-dimethylarginine dimethylaminohydrolase|nr:amidinotransferase [Synergistaceae bacterium]
MNGTAGNSGFPGLNINGERWFPSMRNFEESIADYWGDWYCDSECGKLRAVLMHRPGPEMDATTDPSAMRFKGRIDGDAARREHDKVAEIYKSHGVDVHYIDGYRLDRPNALFTRDQILNTPEGAIVCRPAMEARRGEERFAAEALAKLGVPVIATIHGEGIFEGACAMWLDRRSIIIGSGCRANREGIEQVEWVLKGVGVENIIHFQIPYGHAHLDGLMNIPDRKKIIVFPWQVSYDLCRNLMDMGFRIIENPVVKEVKETFSINFVALEPGKIVMPSGNPETRKILENEGIECMEAEIPEIIKGWGAMHCMTAFLKRDPL